MLSFLLYGRSLARFSASRYGWEECIFGESAWKGTNLIDFWQIIVIPCKVSMPYLHALAEKYDSLTVVLISIDAPKNQLKAKNYLKGKNYSFVALFDAEKSLAKKLNVVNPPHSFIIDSAGEIVYSHVGFEPGTEAQYEQHIRHLLGHGVEAE
jgi:thiol-disulfide isomerase/thioredoxin